MENSFCIGFASSEREFIYSEGVNKGHSTTYSKVNRCLFLSSEAKQLYHNICDYAYGNKRDCFPSLHLLAMELGWGLTKLKQILSELKETKLISTRARVGKPTIYLITELHKVPILYHSEAVYSAIQIYKNESNPTSEELLKKVNAYKEIANLEDDIANSNWESVISSIVSFFNSNNLGEAPKNSATAVIGKKEDTKKVINVPKIIATGTVVEEPANKKKSTVKKGLNSVDEMSKSVNLSDDVCKWGYLHVYRYFNNKYFDKYQNYPTVTVADTVMLKRVLKRKGVEKVLKDIDTYLELDFFTAKGMKSMCSTFVQGVLDEYHLSGRLPSSKGTQQEQITKDADMNDWEKQLENMFGGEGIE